jgi:hypothetical protein
MSLTYNIAINEGIKTSVTVFVDGVPQVATREHPNFDEILAALEEPVDEEKVVALFDLTKPIFDKFDHLSERVTVARGQIFFDGDPVNDTLSEAIVNFYKEDNDDWQRLVSFLEKIATNPNPHSRENLYKWLANHSFAIAPDGDFIGYKSISSDRLSHNSGKATVNGKVVNGRIPNNIGDVIEMPRSDVQHDPFNGCHTGLHVGTWGYASTFGGYSSLLIKVKVNPRDVVSVPVDCGAQKLRCCRYIVLEDTEQPERSIQYTYSESEEQYDDEWSDDWDDDEDDWGDEEETPTFTPHDPFGLGKLIAGLLAATEPIEAYNPAADLATLREARRLELTMASVVDLANTAISASIDLVPIVAGKSLASAIPDIVDAIIAVEFPTE